MINKTHFFAAIPLMLGLHGCATPSATDNADPEFGDSVRQMIDGQLYDRQAGTQPAQNAGSGFDGERAATTLKTHRAQPSAPMNPVSSSVNASGGSKP